MKTFLVTIILGLMSLASGGVDAAVEKSPPRILSVEVQTVTPSGLYGGVAYVTVSGVIHGVIGLDDEANVAGLRRRIEMQSTMVSTLAYDAKFQLIVPAQGQPANQAIVVDAENRGGAVSQGALGGFLQNHATSYGRVQWQTGFAQGQAMDVQGSGLVILRDFARWLKGGAPNTLVTGDFKPTAYDKLILTGVSQSAWFVNTFIAEGFNVDPLTGKGIFNAAVAIDGVGGWLAINTIAADRGVATQIPYVTENGVPLSRKALLSRPKTDPLYVDVANYTDFYRLRAGLTSTPYSSPKFRRYDWPSPHAVGSATSAARCNNGQPVIFNTLRYAPYYRAVVLNVQKDIGVKAAKGAPGLPPSRPFSLGGRAAATGELNGLPGIIPPVPAIDADTGWPIGGVRFPEADHPLGSPLPAAVPPVTTRSISEICGNFGGFQPFDRASLEKRYGSRDAWLKAYAASLDALIRQGFLLTEDRVDLLASAEKSWP